MSEDKSYAHDYKKSLLTMAADHDWELSGEGDIVKISRGKELIEVEYGSGGLPRKITRTRADGTTEVTPFLQIKMSDVKDWLAEDQKDEDE